MTGAQQTALDLHEAVACIGQMWREHRDGGRGTPLNAITYAVVKFPSDGTEQRIAQDPRYIAYCKEQIMIENGWTKHGKAWVKGTLPDGVMVTMPIQERIATLKRVICGVPTIVEQDKDDVESAQAALDEGNFVSLEEIKGEVGLEVIH